MDKVNLEQKFTLFTEQWSPRVIAEANGQYVKLGLVKEQLRSLGQKWRKADKIGERQSE